MTGFPGGGIRWHRGFWHVVRLWVGLRLERDFFGLWLGSHLWAGPQWFSSLPAWAVEASVLSRLRRPGTYRVQDGWGLGPATGVVIELRLLDHSVADRLLAFSGLLSRFLPFETGSRIH